MSARAEPRIAVAFFTHVFGPAVRERFEKLRADLSGRADVFLLAQAGSPMPAGDSDVTHYFDFARLRASASCVLGERIVPGNCHLAWLDFFRSRPDYDQYWIIEYDVAFTGDWTALFDAVADDPADLVAAQIRTREQESAWPWWHTLDFAGDGGAPTRIARAFFPIVRISRRGLEELRRRVAQGWSGHFEALVPTALLAGGATLSELGGDGPWTPAPRRHRFYSAYSTGAGEMLFGTHRFVPPHFLPGFRRNAIYHPVKDRRIPTAKDWDVIRQKFVLGAKQMLSRDFIVYLLVALMHTAGSCAGRR